MVLQFHTFLTCMFNSLNRARPSSLRKVLHFDTLVLHFASVSLVQSTEEQREPHHNQVFCSAYCVQEGVALFQGVVHVSNSLFRIGSMRRSAATRRASSRIKNSVRISLPNFFAVFGYRSAHAASGASRFVGRVSVFHRARGHRCPRVQLRWCGRRPIQMRM